MARKNLIGISEERVDDANGAPGNDRPIAGLMAGARPRLLSVASPGRCRTSRRRSNAPRSLSGNLPKGKRSSNSIRRSSTHPSSSIASGLRPTRN